MNIHESKSSWAETKGAPGFWSIFIYGLVFRTWTKQVQGDRRRETKSTQVFMFTSQFFFWGLKATQTATSPIAPETSVRRLNYFHSWKPCLPCSKANTADPSQQAHQLTKTAHVTKPNEFVSKRPACHTLESWNRLVWCLWIIWAGQW